MHSSIRAGGSKATRYGAKVKIRIREIQHGEDDDEQKMQMHARAKQSGCARLATRARRSLMAAALT